MAVFEGQVTPGGGAPYWVSDVAVPGGTGRLPGTLLFVTVGGILVPVDLASDVYLPTQSVFSDVSGNPTRAGDAANSALRTIMVGGADVVNFRIDGTIYQKNVDGGFPLFMLYSDTNPELTASETAGIPRMTKDRLMHTVGVPRSQKIKNRLSLSTTQELQLLPAGAAGVFHDLTGLYIYTNSPTVRTNGITIDFRDNTNGAVRFSVDILSGSNIQFTDEWIQETGPALPWTAQLSDPVTDGRVVVHAQANKRIS